NWGRRTGEIEAGVQRPGIMLVGEVGCVTGDGQRAMFPGELGVQDVAITQMVAERRILEQRRPLVADMPEIHARDDLVLVTYVEPILGAHVERVVRRIGLPAAIEVDAGGARRTSKRRACRRGRDARIARIEGAELAVQDVDACIEREVTEVE